MGIQVLSNLGRTFVKSLYTRLTTFVLTGFFSSQGKSTFPTSKSSWAGSLLFGFLFFLMASGRSHAISCQKIFEPNGTYEQIMALPPYYYKSIESYVNQAKSVDIVAAAIVDRQSQMILNKKVEYAEQDEFWKNDRNWRSMSALFMKFDPRQADIIIFFPIEQRLNILKRGFLNQHQTGKSMGGYDPKVREDIEDKVAQLKLGSSETSARLRAKFSIVNFREDLPFLNSPGYARWESHKELPPRDDHYQIFQDIAKTYGGVGAVMKSHVKRRATFTSHDTRAGGGARAEAVYTFQTEYMGSGSAHGLYHEAQIYGNLRASDIDYFLVHDVNLVEDLKVFGRPIYEVKQSYYGYRVVFGKGKRLF